jgi:hypothetical protein
METNNINTVKGKTDRRNPVNVLRCQSYFYLLRYNRIIIFITIFQRVLFNFSKYNIGRHIPHIICQSFILLYTGPTYSYMPVLHTLICRSYILLYAGVTYSFFPHTHFSPRKNIRVYRSGI